MADIGLIGSDNIGGTENLDLRRETALTPYHACSVKISPRANS
jgi:hypothetical protein